MNIHMKARILGFPADRCIVYGLCYSHQLSFIVLAQFFSGHFQKKALE